MNKDKAKLLKTVESLDDGVCYITVDKAIRYARDGASSIERGYGAYDVYCSQDIPGQTISEIIDELWEENHE